MHLFAHNGIEHATELEESVHTTSGQPVQAFLITATVIALLIIASLVVRKLTTKTKPVKQEEE